MQHARKLVLVDEFDREYKRVQRPADAVAKTDRSLQLSSTLDHSSSADDRRAREYVAALHRYLNVGDTVPRERVVKVNTQTELPRPPTARSVSVGTPSPRPRKRKRRNRIIWSPY